MSRDSYRGSPTNDNSGYRPRDLLESLRQMPLLEHLDLHYATPLSSDASSEELRMLGELHAVNIVPLPNLKTFACKDRPPVLPMVLARLDIPATCSFTVLSEVGDEPGDVPNTVAALASKLLVGYVQNRRHIHSLIITSESNGGRRLHERTLEIVGCAHRHACLCGDVHGPLEMQTKCTDPCVRITLSYGDRSRLNFLDGLPEIFDLISRQHGQEVEVLGIETQDVYNSLKSMFGLLDAHEVPTQPAPGILSRRPHHFDFAARLKMPRLEFKAGLQLLSTLKTVCVDARARTGEWERTLARDMALRKS